MPQIPAGRRETTLGEMIDYIVDNRGKTPPITDIGYELLEVNAVSATSRIPDYSKVSKFISAETFHNWFRKGTLKKWDILVPTVGTIGSVAYSQNNRWAIAQNLVALRVNDESNSLFWYYLLKSPYVQKSLLNLDIGWVQPSIKVPHLLNLPIHLPPFPEQQAIAAVLSSFDDKIELLRAENQTLEQMGQELFKERFGKSPNIKVWMLGDWVDVKRGSSPRPIQDYISEKGYKWLKISDASAVDSPFIFDIKECIREEGLNKTILLKSGTLVLSNSATPGIPKILAVDSCIHDGWLHFPKSRFSNEFLYLLFKEIRPKLIQQGSGSVFTNLKTDILKKYEIPIPEQETLSKFDLVIKPLFNKIRANSDQIQTLSATRDQLLPKLMSWEMRVEF